MAVVLLGGWLAVGGQEGAPTKAQSPTIATHGDPFGVRRLELELNVRQGQVAEAREWAIIERRIYGQVVREKSVLGSSSRRVEIHEQAKQEAEAYLAYRLATRDAAAIELGLAKQRAAVGSPEEDIDQARARLDAGIKSMEARVAAWDAQMESMDMLVRSEQASLANLTKFFESGTITPVALTQAEFRFHQAEASRDRALARRDIARMDLEDARRARAEVDHSAGSPDDSRSSDPLEKRVRALEMEVRRLEDEAEFVSRRLQRRLEADQKYVDRPMQAY